MVMAIAPLITHDEDIRQSGRVLGDMRRSAADLTPGASLEISRAFPVYRSEAGNAALDLRTSRLTTWRYLVFAEGSSEPSLTVDVEPDGEHEIVAIAGASADLMPALRLAETAAAHADFELRAIEVPAADAAALWLHGEEDLFIDMMTQGQSLAVAAPAYLEPVNALLATRAARPEAGSRP
jgi:hypothetical protein